MTVSGGTKGSAAPSVTPQESDQLLESGALLLDVRELDEWQAGHVADAVHIPLSTLTSEVDRIPQDRPVLCICRSGGRSGQAADWLIQSGYDAWNMAGGMQAWAAAGRPYVNEAGSPGTVI